MQEQPNQALYLFSSNIRPLYARDILNVMSAPSGTTYTFRYERRYLGPGLAEQWTKDLVGTKTIVHFSLQQNARYHDPVFFPIRIGTVHQVQKLGEEIFLIEFVLGRLVSLTPPGPEGSKDRFSSAALTYTEYLRNLLTDPNVPHAASIGMGPDVTQDASAPLDATTDEIALFDRTTKYLAQTDTYSDTWFVQVLGISQGADDSLDAVRNSRLDTKRRLFSLVAGRTYRLHILQRQPREVYEEVTFSVKTDGEVLKVVGDPNFTLGSRYDRIVVPLHAVEPADGQPRVTVVTVEPNGVEGPSITLPVTVTPSPAQAQVAVGTGLALLVLGVVGFRQAASGLEKALWVGAAFVVHLMARSGTLISAWRGRRVK